MVRTAFPVREAHLYPPHLPFPKHRPIVENGTFSTGPFVRNRREPRPGRPCEAPPTQDICLRGGRGPARRMESSPAPGSLWFLSPAGKELARPQTCETPSSRIFLLPVCLLFPHITLRQSMRESDGFVFPLECWFFHRLYGIVLRHYRTIRRQRWRCLFCHLLLAEILIYLQ